MTDRFFQLLFVFSILLLQTNFILAEELGPKDEFLDGNTNTFSTKDHLKAKGANFKIEYPKSWSAQEGNHPNVVQTFISKNGKGTETAVITTKELPIPADEVLTKDDYNDFFSVSNLKKMMPPEAVFIDAKRTEIESTPAGILEYRVTMERVGLSMSSQTWTLNFITNNNIFVQINFSVSDIAGSEQELKLRMESFKPLFIKMANSIVLPDNWGVERYSISSTKTPSFEIKPIETQNPNTLPLIGSNKNLVAEVIILSFLVTYGLGLTPAILIRYVFIRRPLSKKSATWIALGFSTFFWFSFLLLNHLNDQKPGTGAAWVIVFIIARWIMCRSPSENDDQDGNTTKSDSDKWGKSSW